ncbi:hypothetical protein CLOM_g8726 [Closterium sp. NIES-68]|nr:hypothetical protein CLOM_g8726 [Closterium sp. NIES-68]GJP68604.1 hypothetical protein CLOP_g25284 [Closterium sp. NIES-67]
MPRGKEQYDDDDWDDGYDDEDYDEDEDDYDEYEEAGRLQAKTQKGGKQQPQAKQPQTKQPAQQQKPQQQQQQQAAGKAASKSPASKAGSATTDTQGGMWRCPACTFDNPALFLACDVCSAARPASAEPFDFATPSPDEAIRSALKAGHVAPRGAATSAALPAFAATTTTAKNASSSSTSRVSSSASPAADVAAAGVGKMQIAEGSRKEASPSASTTATTAATGATAATAAVDPKTVGVGEGEGEREDEEERRRKALEAYEAEGWIREGPKGGEDGGTKPTLHLIVLGHVDAGKSTIMGHLLHKLGRVSNKEMHRVQRDATNQGKGSFAFAWVLDESSEERARGVTMSVAMSRFETPRFNVVLLDAPGHRDFVPSMIAGTAQADAALLVIDATPGAFEAGMGGGQGGEDVGQSKEHAQIARSLGVEQLGVVVNKMDAAGFDQGEFERIKGVLGPFLTRQCGFREGSVKWVPLSGLEGENLDKPPTDDRLKKWYMGPTLLEAVDSFSPPPRALNRPLRLAIAEVLKTRGLGQAGVAGKVECGAMRPGTKVLVMPGSFLGTVKALERDESPVAAAWAGESADVGLQGVDANQLLPGGVLCHPDFPIPVATRVECRLLTLDLKIPLLRGTNAILHAHAAKEACRIVSLTAILDSKTGAVAKARPRAVGSNQSAIVELSLERGMCLEAYSDFRAFGRIALRDGGRTLAVGIVLRILVKTTS